MKTGKVALAEDMAGGAAEDHLPQAALRIGALDEQVAAERGGAFENDFAGGARAGFDGHRLGLDAVAAQMARGVLARRPGSRCRPRRSARSPARPAAAAAARRHWCAPARCCDSRRPARSCRSTCGACRGTISTGLPLSNSAASSGGMRGFSGVAPRPPEHDEIEHAAVAADEAHPRPPPARPAIGKRAAGSPVACGTPFACMKASNAALRVARGVAVKGAGDRQAADRLDRHIGAGRGAHREAFDIAVEGARHQPGCAASTAGMASWSSVGIRMVFMTEPLGQLD